MPRLIYKYPVEVSDKQTISMPVGHKILSVGLQSYRVCLWAEVDTEASSQPVEIYIAGTGHSVPENARFIGSVQQGPFVWHVYEGLVCL